MNVKVEISLFDNCLTSNGMYFCRKALFLMILFLISWCFRVAINIKVALHPPINKHRTHRGVSTLLVKVKVRAAFVAYFGRWPS